MVICEKKKASVRVYTRQAEPGIYPDGLARSVHFSVKWENGAEEPLNAGYGILFAEGTIQENNTICPKCVADARIAARKDGTFAVTARRVEEDGSEDEESRGKLLLWLTKDFISFEACGLVEEKEAQRERELPRADTAWAAEDVCARALLYWGKLEQTGIRLPERAAVSSSRSSCPSESFSFFCRPEKESPSSPAFCRFSYRRPICAPNAFAPDLSRRGSFFPFFPFKSFPHFAFS